jgi:DNA-binding NtrC family response regulator
VGAAKNPALRRVTTFPAIQPGAHTVAVVDDDAVLRRLMRHWLESAGFHVVDYACGRDVVVDTAANLSAVCLDLGLDDVPGMDVLEHLRARDRSLPVIVVTAQRSIDTAVEALRAGAYDYLVKPTDEVRLAQAVTRAVEHRELAGRVRTLQAELEVQHGLKSILGQSAPMQALHRQVQRVLDSDVSVVVEGESGTGKEVVARAIHASGRRSRGPFVPVNCAAIPQTLQESELFGHERGAFTGATGTYRGRFEQAAEGTLFLDEVGEMSLPTQAALLRALQERVIRRIGGTTEIPVNVRVICATHRDLAAETKAGRFREDLFFRLVVYPVRVPPLRERIDDIPLLASHFLQSLAADVGRAIHRVSPQALHALCLHTWPGNVRELQNTIHRAMLSCDGDEIGVADLPPDLRANVLPRMPPVSAPDVPRVPTGDEAVVPLEELERRAIAHALRVAGGNVSTAAKLLGIGRATLYRRMNELHVPDKNDKDEKNEKSEKGRA